MSEPVDNDKQTPSPPSDVSDGRRHLLAETLTTLRRWLTEEGQPRYRAEQIADWIYAKHAESFDQMTNLSKSLRAWLNERATLYQSCVARESVSTDGTSKLLLRWPDDATVETVWIPEAERNTACISSQVGCPVGCRFCASGLGGLQRNLTAGEIVEQAMRVRRLIAASTEGESRLTNIVMMGMGEPLANYDAVMEAIRIFNAPWGMNIGARKITVSTVGLPKQIRQLADEGLQFNLALSLHAADEDLRRELIPWGNIRLAELVSACAYFFKCTGREVTLEYTLLDEVNTRQRDAADLVAVARSLRCNVNLLRYNPVPGLAYRRPSAETTYAFQRELRNRGLNAHIRTSRGQDIAAACGQLRRAVESDVPCAAEDAEGE